MMVRFADIVFADVAVMVAVCVVGTDVVLTVNVPLVWPAGMVMEAGTVAAELPEDRETSTPVVPAGLPSVTVPVEVAPPVTAVGFSVIAEIVPGIGPFGLTCTFSSEQPFVVALMPEVRIEVRIVSTLLIESETGAVVCPAGTRMLPRFTPAPTKSICWPPAGAGPVRVTWPVRSP